MSSAAVGGPQTSRGMSTTMPIQGTGNSLTLMGKTTLFSRVALSPNATMGDGGKKGGAFNL